MLHPKEKEILELFKKELDKQNVNQAHMVEVTGLSRAYISQVFGKFVKEGYIKPFKEREMRIRELKVYATKQYYKLLK